MNFTNSRKFVSTLAVATLFSFSCRSQEPIVPKTAQAEIVKIDLTQRFQTIENFAASDAWSAQFIGLWPDSSRDAIADLLFSTEMKDGQPRGIGLSMWRFNIGAGSTQQGDASGIRDEWRRAESFLGNDGKYNWNLQAGQMWFLKAAKDRGVSKFLGFTNSPPVHLTANGKAFATAARPNLNTANFDAYAIFLADVVKGIKEKLGLELNYLSPVNEPQWDWSDGGQEGTPFTNNDITGIVKSLSTQLAKDQLKTKILVTEAGKYDYLFSPADKPIMGNQIDAFFNPSSPNHIGEYPSVEKVIAGHSYFTTSPYTEAEATRKKLRTAVATTPDLRFWQSEYCILGDNAGDIKGEGRDLGIGAALYLSKVIQNDLINANASAWQWWTAISPYDYKDGLVYVDKNKSSGRYYPSKMLWALGNFSRFIRPGSVRVNVTASPSGILVSSYLDNAANKVITVLVNDSNVERPVNLTISGGSFDEGKLYVTSQQDNLTPQKTLNKDTEILLKPKSINTVVYDLKR